ncbi:MAG: hypothetical protein RIQ94_3273 [Pseudomonadota bacterium]|jgi:hypothetical protein
MLPKMSSYAIANPTYMADIEKYSSAIEDFWIELIDKPELIYSSKCQEN